jgi:pimeloyl-ACP methyl ester carboxylesterase
VPDGRGHAAHLAVAPLAQHQLEPGGRDATAGADRHRARREGRLPRKQPRLGRRGAAALHHHAAGERAQRRGAGRALDLHPVAARVALARLGERAREGAVVGQQQEPLAVVVEAAGGVDALHRDEAREARVTGLGAEAREHPVRLPEGEDPGHARRPRMQQLHVEIRGTGPALLLLHGFAGSARNWRPQVRALAGAWRTIAFDARGHARSAAPDDPAAYGAAALVADALGVLAGAGEARAVWVGLSMGAAVALEAALRAPGAVRALVLFSIPAGRGAARGLSARAAAFADAIEREGLEAAGERFAWGPGSGLDARGAELVRQGFLEHAPHGLAHTLRGFLAGWAPIAERGAELARLAVPTLVVAGERDAASLEPSRALAAAIPGAELAVLPEAGHVVNLARPAQTNALLLRFLASLPEESG